MLMIEKNKYIMKKNKSLFVVILLASLIMGGCKKYDEGPYFSLHSKRERIIGEWKLEKTYIDGVADGFKIGYATFMENGAYVWESYHQMTSQNQQGWVISSHLDSYNGAWEFCSDFEILKITMGDSKEYEIMRLSNKELFIEVEIDNCVYRLEFEKI